MMLQLCLLVMRTTHAMSSDRDLQSTIQFCLLGLVLTFMFLHLADPTAFARAALIE